MKKIILMTAAILLVAILLVGCTYANTTKTIIFTTEVGDRVNVKVDTSGGYDISTSSPFAISKDNTTLTEGTFIQANGFAEYVSAAENDANATIIERGKDKNGNDYVFWTYNNEEFNYVVQIAGANVGVILGNIVSEQSAKEVFERLAFSLAD